MRRKDLPLQWCEWQGKRRRELVADGVPLATALQFSIREAAARCRIAAKVGFDAAVKAELVSREVANEDRFYLTGDLKDVPPERRDLLEPGEVALTF